MAELKQKGRNALKERRALDKAEREAEREFRLREPNGPSPFELFRENLPVDAKPFALLYWHMECEHRGEKIIAGTSTLDHYEPVWMRCPDCGLVRRWFGNRTATKKQEWMSYCPEGYDMFEWDELYQPSRPLWRFIHDEVLVSQVDEAMTKED